MRLWSIHPKYLDARGLVALWREALLARKVLAGETSGYTRHPQLVRFRECPFPLSTIALYINAVWEEANNRGYQFDRNKIPRISPLSERLAVTRGQLQFEHQHLLAKLASRDPDRHAALQKVKRIVPHPLFRVVPGERESWER